jgi:hypothetical protein
MSNTLKGFKKSNEIKATRIVTVNIREDQKQFIDQESINFSKLVRSILDQLIKESQDQDKTKKQA